jgi:hypothetical protein
MTKGGFMTDINKQVAEKMGIEWFGVECIRDEDGAVAGFADCSDENKSYTENIQDAWEIVEYMKLGGNGAVRWLELSDEESHWRASFVGADEATITGKAPTAPLAIVRAFLATGE